MSTKLLRAVSKKHVVMTVNNDCVQDARVIKTAECLADYGCRVTVVCVKSERLAISTYTNGVNYVRLGNIKTPTYNPPPIIPVEVPRWRRYLRYAVTVPKKVLRRSHSVARAVSRPIRALLRNTYAADQRRIGIITGKKFDNLAGATVWKLCPDIIHCHDLSTLLCGIEAGRLLKVPVIYDAHELETERNSQYTQRVWKAIKLRERELIRECAGVVTCSDSIASHLHVKYGLDAVPTVTYNAPSPSGTGLDGGRTVRDVCGLADHTPLAVYVGLISVNRGIEDCIRSLQYGDHHLALVGPYNETFLEDMMLLASELGLFHRLHVVSAVTPDQVPAFISTADASLMLIPKCCLSYDYCMPNKLFESLLAGVPVIASERKDMAKFVRSHNCGMVLRIPGPQEIARAVYYVTRNREWYQTSAPVMWTEQASKLLRLYGGILNADSYHRIAA